MVSKSGKSLTSTRNTQARELVLIEKLILMAAVATPLMTLPQLYKIWVEHNKGASLITWVSYVLIAVIWLYYGLHKKDKPLIVMESLCVVVYGLVVIGLVR